jgi:VWFA-related protein
MKRIAGKQSVSFNLCFLLAGMMLCAVLSAQQRIGSDEVRVSSRPYSPSQPMIRVRTSEVRVAAVVRDLGLKPVSGLQKQDFEIYDQGRKQVISGFSVLTVNEDSPIGVVPTASRSAMAGSFIPIDQPGRYIALFFDDVNTEQGELARTLVAARGYVTNVMTSRERLAVFTASDTQNLDFTDDKGALLAVLERIRLHPRYAFRGEGACPLITVYEAYLNSALNDLNEAQNAARCYAPGVLDAPGALFDPNVVQARVQADQTWGQAREAFLDTLARVESVIDHLSNAPGTRILLMVSDGFIAGPFEREKDHIVERAIQSGVVINSLDAKALYAEAPGGPIGEIDGELTSQAVHRVQSLGPKIQANNAVMAEFADATGGRFIHNTNDLLGGLRELAVAPQISYLLSFTPSVLIDDGKFHKLKVRVREKRYDIQARPGYFAPTKLEASRMSPEEKLDHEMRSVDTLSAVPILVTTSPIRLADGVRELPVHIHVDLRPLQFQKQKDREVQQLDFIVALFDDKGDFVTGKQGEMDLALREPSYTQLQQTGVEAGLILQAAPGHYRLRTVVEEAVSNRLAAVAQLVQIH